MANLPNPGMKTYAWKNLHWSLRAVAGLLLAGGLCSVLPVQENATGWSLFPPLCAILVGVLSGRLIPGLCLAVFGTGVLVSRQDRLWQAVGDGLLRASHDYLWLQVTGAFSLYILAFTVALIGMVRVTSLAGGNAGIAEMLSRGAEGAKSARKATVLLGLAIFFDDYANTIVVGSTMRPITDRFRVCREKLAYLVDSTAAPIAGLAFISTWIGYEVGLFEDLMQDLNTGYSGYQLFFAALPFRFYCLFALTFVVTSTWLGRDFGPMLRAERRARETGQVIRQDARPLTGQRADVQTAQGVPHAWWVAAWPVFAVIAAVIGGIAADAAGNEVVLAAKSARGVLNVTYWTAAFSNADSARVLFHAALIGSAIAVVLAMSRTDAHGRRPISFWTIAATYGRSIIGIQHALAILVLAWAIKEACTDVGTADYLTAALSPVISPNVLPLLIFLLASVIAFSIGTSWATMAILVPTVVPLAHDLGGLPLTIMAASAVLDGAIFGDHCSPISDTTVMSSIASGSDHLDHVRTQIPYAVTTMVCAALFGYLGTTFFYPVWVGLLLGFATIATILSVFGRQI